MEHIFISYRRKDSQDAVGRIHDHLDLYFGPQVTFRDIDNIQGGTNFLERLNTALRHCRLVLAIVGPTWLVSKNRQGRRLNDPSDLVRIELRTALERKLPVIPVLVSFASMPACDQLPPDLQGLTIVQSVSVPPDRSFATGMRELVDRIHTLTGLPYENYLGLLRGSQEIGLVTISNDFANDRTELMELSQSRELILVMNDGRSWMRANRERLRERIRDSSKRTRIVLLHPRSDFIDILINKNKKTRSQQIEDIKSSFDVLQISPGRPELLEVRGHYGFNPFTLILTDNYAFVSPYMFNERGALPLMKFTSQTQSGLYHQIRQDAEMLFDNARPLNAQDFA
jgi:hypothetical protein